MCWYTQIHPTKCLNLIEKSFATCVSPQMMQLRFCEHNKVDLTIEQINMLISTLSLSVVFAAVPDGNYAIWNGFWHSAFTTVIGPPSQHIPSHDTIRSLQWIREMWNTIIPQLKPELIHASSCLASVATKMKIFPPPRMLRCGWHANAEWYTTTACWSHWVKIRFRNAE